MRITCKHHLDRKEVPYLCQLHLPPKRSFKINSTISKPVSGFLFLFLFSLNFLYIFHDLEFYLLIQALYEKCMFLTFWSNPSFKSL